MDSRLPDNAVRRMKCQTDNPFELAEHRELEISPSLAFIIDERQTDGQWEHLSPIALRVGFGIALEIISRIGISPFGQSKEWVIFCHQYVFWRASVRHHTCPLRVVLADVICYFIWFKHKIFSFRCKDSE